MEVRSTNSFCSSERWPSCMLTHFIGRALPKQESLMRRLKTTNLRATIFPLAPW